MRVAIDIRTVTQDRTGVGNYVLNLVTALAAAAPKHELFFVANPENLAFLPLAAERVIEAPMSHESHPAGDLWEHFKLPRLLARRGIEVFHGPMVLIPLAGSGFARVATIHDLVPFLFPKTVPAKYAWYMRWLLRRTVKAVDVIICPSHSTKRDLVEVLKAPPERVRVIAEAAGAGFAPAQSREEVEGVLARHGVTQPYILYLGNLEPRKNLPRLIEAFLLLRRRGGPRVQLVVGGQKAWLPPDLTAGAGAMDNTRDIVFTGYLPGGDLPPLMAGAEVFAFPSLYEGFGLPVMEAMATGTPVVAARAGSLPELVGEAGVLVDPYSPASIAEGLEAVLSDRELRRRLCRLSLARAARFSWARAAEETLDAYGQASGRRR